MNIKGFTDFFNIKRLSYPFFACPKKGYPQERSGQA
jgi:hypothetical protein